MIPLKDTLIEVVEMVVGTRPSYKELSKKIKDAQMILGLKPGLFADLSKAVGELYHLDIEDSNDVWSLIRELLKEIVPSDYAGGRPPVKSYEPNLKGSELFAFSWQSVKCAKKMYLKFILKDECFYYVSLHEDRPLKVKRGETYEMS